MCYFCCLLGVCFVDTSFVSLLCMLVCGLVHFGGCCLTLCCFDGFSFFCFINFALGGVVLSFSLGLWVFNFGFDLVRVLFTDVLVCLKISL